MITTTLKRIKKESPCANRWKKLLRNLNKTKADNEPLALERILESNGFEDALWALRAVDGYRNAMMLYDCFCARFVLDIFEKECPEDKRPRHAIETAERYARGQATIEELKAAWVAAGRAAQTALRAAARYAAWSAAWSAAWVAAGKVAQTALQSALQSAYAVQYAVETAAEAAARETFKAEFLRLCRLEGEYGEVDKKRVKHEANHI